MERRVRRTAAAALSCAFLAVWAVCQVLLGATTGTATGAARPVPDAPPAVAAPVAPAPAPAAVRLGPAGAEVRRTADRPDVDVVRRQTAAAEPGVRLPALPPAALPAARTDAPRPRPGTYASGPRQERAPPSGHYDPRHTRGPPSTRSS
ncbi:hypothetical protein ACFRAR_17845 [Kitasatospora sp. NPDC056651]|uniref:hypothetical protein n=1 Tax=Kitasatospora sp. NPDC056651 TaxID=3345892 RepID=UPI00367B41AC